jgi:ribosomal protein S18 acetylase RimI-like enzyme
MNEERTDVVVREFEAGDEAAFRRLNEEWITRYFKLEPKDEYAFAKPRETILSKGGKIFFAVRASSDGEEVLGCCTLVAMAPGEFEVAKMAVTASAQGLGLGRMLMEHVIAAAKTAGASRLFLETNHALTPAIRLYESVGFTHIPKERAVPSPYERADVPMEMWVG